MEVVRTFKYRVYPTQKQEQEICAVLYDAGSTRTRRDSDLMCKARVIIRDELARIKEEKK
jgi:hypothetical protein